MAEHFDIQFEHQSAIAVQMAEEIARIRGTGMPWIRQLLFW